MTADEMFKTAMELHQGEKFPEAEAMYRKLLTLAPGHPVAKHFLGMVLHHQRRSDEAYPLVKESAEVVDCGGFWANLGSVCRALKKYGEAEAALLQGLEKEPQVAHTLNNLGNVYTEMERLDEAVEAYRRCLAIDERFPDARANLAKALSDGGRHEEGLREYRRALADLPNPNVHANMCYYMHFNVKQTAAAIFEEYERWGNLYGGDARRPAVVDARGDRVLKVGYVGGDFREHPAGHLLLPLIEHHDKKAFEVFLYATVTEKYGLRNRFERAAKCFVPCGELSDEELAQRVRSDGVDILVDCSNHTEGNRLHVFALRPAPLQFTMVGFPSTTGMRAIDYRLTDSYFDPVGEELPSTEELVRIDPCAWCYDPGEGVPEVGREGLAMERNGYVTFGSQNGLHKSGEGSVELWSEILRRVPSGRMMLVGERGEGKGVPARDRVVRMFAERGIGLERLVMVDRCKRLQYFSRYAEMDVGLDAFPGHGGLTTLDALYMGVPVVTLAGKTYAGRTGVSLLSNVGLGDLVARDAEEYVEKAVGLAGDVGRLRELRAKLRGRMREGALMDGAGYAQRVEGVYREKWRLLVQK